jgi:NADH-quinone oxidoreductase subunit J
MDPLTGKPLRAIAPNENSDEVLSVLQRVLSPTNTQVTGSSEEAGLGVPPPHVAGLGGTLFTDHLVTVEVAGAILFVALIAAVSITTPRTDPRTEPAVPA